MSVPQVAAATNRQHNVRINIFSLIYTPFTAIYCVGCLVVWLFGCLVVWCFQEGLYCGGLTLTVLKIRSSKKFQIFTSGPGLFPKGMGNTGIPEAHATPEKASTFLLFGLGLLGLARHLDAHSLASTKSVNLGQSRPDGTSEVPGLLLS